MKTKMRKKTIQMTKSSLQSAGYESVSGSSGSYLILVAAGSSSRLGLGKKKEYLPLNGGTVLSSAARPFLQAMRFAVLAVTYPHFDNPDDDEKSREACKVALYADGFVAESGVRVLFVSGGDTRQKSVLNALEAIENLEAEDGGAASGKAGAMKGADGAAGTAGGDPVAQSPLVFIHDGARPFVKEETILLTSEAAARFGASVPGLTPVDTQDEIDGEGFIVRHLVRSSLVAVQTPQVFRFAPLLAAHRLADENHTECTDDTEIWDRFADLTACAGRDGSVLSRVKVVEGDISNKKITYRSDLEGMGFGSEGIIKITSL